MTGIVVADDIFFYVTNVLVLTISTSQIRIIRREYEAMGRKYPCRHILSCHHSTVPGDLQSLAVTDAVPCQTIGLCIKPLKPENLAVNGIGVYRQ